MTDFVTYSPARSRSSSAGRDSTTSDDDELLPQLDPDLVIFTSYLKYRDNKRWKTRFGILTKISPAADCLHLQLYRDSKDRYKQGQTKASLSLQHFLGVESGFTLDKESNTIAILCQDVTVVLAFDTRERLIQWQVKIANHLGEDQQYLVQIGSSPVKTKISPGPARLHVQEYRFSLTLGAPPRLIGVWNISQLRRYGVVENRFCFEGGSGCGRLEGLYVLVTDQGEEITKAFREASEGKLIPKRKQISRNQSVASVMESPRRRIPRSTKPTSSIDGSEPRQASERATWESAETNNSSEYGDTVSVADLDCSQSGDTWRGGPSSNCVNCNAISQLPRSLTVMNTPGTGFNPAWIMEATSNAGAYVQESSHVNCCCEGRMRSRALSPTPSHSTARTCSVHRPLSMADPPQHHENYDTPRALIGTSVDDQPQSRASLASVGELYDTPKKIRETVHLHKTPCLHHCAVAPPHCPICPIHRHCAAPPRAHPQPINSCHLAFPCQTVTCTPQPILVCSCGAQRPQPIEPCAIYATVDLMKKSKKKSVPVEPECSTKTVECTKENERNYANMGFAQSLEHYENVKELRVKLEEPEQQALIKDEDYLMMGPVVAVDSEPQTPPYLPMKPGSAESQCSCHPPPPLPPPPISSSGGPQSSSSSSTPMVRRREPTTSYMTPEQRRMAQIRRRSNSMDSGRHMDALECITERTASSSTHNTLTPNSASNSVDSLPSERSETPKKYRPIPPQSNQPLEPSSLSQVRCLLEMELSRRPSSVPCKSNRDSSSSNDSGVSTGSLKNFGAGFLEFETIVTPLSKLRQKSAETVPVITPRRSKSSEPLDELVFDKLKDLKSSSAEAEVPLCHQKKDSKDLSISSSSGALTIPYIDSISSSSGASDMSDYIETLSMSSFSSSDHDNQRQNHSAVTVLRPRSGKEYQKIDRTTLEYGKVKLTSAQHADSPSPGYISSTSSN